ncbi:NAD(P)/FAD-dependent oxidoreductase [Spartinivicinus ruber]|uniref:NAD(P)/FAD-dependent oxidoreductase n=1 Tax=Spartinivicinus ruber TaxID=2683272 RepID=UPI0013D60E09|nr:FAD-binding oxidoreductase [Spartinivicinus ruber]
MKSVIIIGAGINGLMTAYEFNRAGWHVTVVDQGSIPNPKSASHGLHRLIHPYTPNKPERVNATKKALNMWHNLWGVLGQTHFYKTGVVLLEKQDVPWLTASYKLSFDDACKLMPILSGSTKASAYLFPEYGVLMASQILQDLVTLLAKLGVSIRSNQKVQTINSTTATVATITGEKFSADFVVITAGIGTSALLGQMNHWEGLSQQNFATKRCFVLYAELPTTLIPVRSYMPAWTFPAYNDLWGIPLILDIPLKLGCGSLTHTVDTNDLPINENHLVSQFIMHFKEFFPNCSQIKPKLLAYNHRTQGPTDMAQVFRNDLCYLVSACSGIGFKYAPLTAKTVVDYIDA